MQMDIYTSSYESCGTGIKAISIDGRVSDNFQGKVLMELMPMGSWLSEWKNNMGKAPEDENMSFYIKSYFESVLNPIGVDRLFQLLRGSVIVSSERAEDFSSREIISAYLELYFGRPIYEVIIDESGNVKRVARNKYYKTIKDSLEELIKGKIEMYYFQCIAAAYAYRQALYLEEHTDFCKRFPISSESYKRLAEVLESDYVEKKCKRK